MIVPPTPRGSAAISRRASAALPGGGGQGELFGVVPAGQRSSVAGKKYTGRNSAKVHPVNEDGEGDLGNLEAAIEAMVRRRSTAAPRASTAARGSTAGPSQRGSNAAAGSTRASSAVASVELLDD
mmetsp:Transcript_29560/g.94847  ORF Transcript_29560/g.94847 Transcript_29560/m.94847 type:complete len:125 (+) Transcript_29560:106-480(+)